MIKRYNVGDWNNWGQVEAPTGRYVLYSDHAAMIAEKDRIIRALCGSVKDILVYVAEDFPNGPNGPAVATEGYRSAYHGSLKAVEDATASATEAHTGDAL